MENCFISGCCFSKSRTNQPFQLFHVPSDKTRGPRNPMKSSRRDAWLKAIDAAGLPNSVLNSVRVCSRHFVTGRPANGKCRRHVDWIPSINLKTNVKPTHANKMPQVRRKKPKSVESIIANTPLVITKFDRPEYVLVDESKFNQREIERNLIRKYITSPICNEDGLYDNDHDYLGLPLLPLKTEKRLINTNLEHNYSLLVQPACFYFDSRHFCNICQRDCDNLFNFNSHIDHHTMNNNVQCCICFQMFLTTTCLNNHLNSHTDLCEICGNEVPSVQLEAHQKVNLKQKLEKSDIHRYQIPRGKKIYFCIFCMEKFDDEYVFSEHGDRHKRGN